MLKFVSSKRSSKNIALLIPGMFDAIALKRVPACGVRGRDSRCDLSMRVLMMRDRVHALRDAARVVFEGSRVRRGRRSVTESESFEGVHLRSRRDFRLKLSAAPAALTRLPTKSSRSSSGQERFSQHYAALT